MPTLHPKIADVLAEAYAPCRAFGSSCQSMRWAPPSGHIPRGYTGGFGDTEDVELVLVCAEPGDPHSHENYENVGDPQALVAAANETAFQALQNGTDLFHRNIRYILDLCWPRTTLEQQLRRAWLTDSVLCSAADEGGHIPRSVEVECRRRYLERQLQLFPRATVVALGAKAQRRMRGWPGLLHAYSVAPPGCNLQEARQSWDAIAEQVRNKSASSAEKSMHARRAVVSMPAGRVHEERQDITTQDEHADWRVLEIDGFSRSNRDSVKSAIRYQSELTKPNSTIKACGLGYDLTRKSPYVFLHHYASVNFQETLREAGFETVVPNTQPDRWLLVPNASIGTVSQLAQVLLRAAEKRYYG